MANFPYGECECRGGCQCEGTAGPAAYEIERDGKKMKVCTRCDLSSDSSKKLLLKPNDEIKPFWDYDAIGTFCFTAHVTEES